MKNLLTDPNFRKVLAAGSVCAVLGAWAPSAKAQTTYTWSSTSALNTVFSDAGNWTPGGGPPGSADNVTFGTSNVEIAVTGSSAINDFSMGLASNRTLRSGGGGDGPRYLTIGGTLSKDGTGSMIFNSQSSNRPLNLEINQVEVSDGILALGSNSSGYVQSVAIGSATVSGGILQFVVASGSVTIANDLGFTGAGTIYVRERQGTGSGQSGILSVGSLSSSAGNGVIEVNNRTSGSNVTGLLSLNNAAGTSAYSGVLRDGGTVGNVLSVEKNNAGTQVLSGASTYTGATTVNAGTLLVGEAGVGSLGNTAVTVNAGTLGGTGTTGGAVTVGNGAGGPDAFLAAGDGAGSIGAFTIAGSLSLDSDAAFVFEYNGTTAVADLVSASGVTITGGLFSITNITSGVLAVNTQFTVIDNTSGGAIGGVFSNLAEGALITSGANQFQATYLGGTGNDLVLTVVPEPAATALLGLGLAAMLRRRRAS